MSKKKLKYKCPCCGYYTFTEKPEGSWDICPVCRWEDGYFLPEDPYEDELVLLNELRENFKKFGACIPERKGCARPPKEDELTGLDD